MSGQIFLLNLTFIKIMLRRQGRCSATSLQITLPIIQEEMLTKKKKKNTDILRSQLGQMNNIMEIKCQREIDILLVGSSRTGPDPKTQKKKKIISKIYLKFLYSLFYFSFKYYFSVFFLKKTNYIISLIFSKPPSSPFSHQRTQINTQQPRNSQPEIMISVPT